MNRPAVVLLLATSLAAGCATRDRRDAPTAMPATRAPAVPAVAATPRMTIGELLAKGGKQLSAKEVDRLLTGATVEGVAGNMTWRAENRPDGHLIGETVAQSGDSLSYRGTWWVDEQGRRCWLNDRRARFEPYCTYFYRLGTEYYASDSDASDKATLLESRKITRPSSASRQ
jgi:hypothetical protein